jgi:hypothetical protein
MGGAFRPGGEFGRRDAQVAGRAGLAPGWVTSQAAKRNRAGRGTGGVGANLVGRRRIIAQGRRCSDRFLWYFLARLSTTLSNSSVSVIEVLTFRLPLYYFVAPVSLMHRRARASRAFAKWGQAVETAATTPETAGGRQAQSRPPPAPSGHNESARPTHLPAHWPRASLGR